MSEFEPKTDPAERRATRSSKSATRRAATASPGSRKTKAPKGSASRAPSGSAKPSPAATKKATARRKSAPAKPVALTKNESPGAELSPATIKRELSRPGGAEPRSATTRRAPAKPVVEAPRAEPRSATTSRAPGKPFVEAPRAAATEHGKTVSVEERRRMIAERAFHKAVRRGFRDGDPQSDWIEAEAEIDAMLAAPSPKV